VPLCGHVVETGKPLYSLESFTNLRTGSDYDVDRLLLPLSSDGQQVDVLMVFFKFKPGAPTRLPQETPAYHRAKRNGRAG
jgi:hypothetical protein